MSAISDDIDSPESRESYVVGYMSATAALALLSVVLRITCRLKSHAGLWWDDWLILVAMLFLLSLWILLMTIVRHYVGHHLGTVDFSHFDEFGKTYYYAQISYPVTLTIIKFSILCLYWRVFNKSARWPIFALGAFALLWGIVESLIIIFQCNPIEGGWDLLNVDRNCFNFKEMLLYGPVPHVICDLGLIILPLPYIFRLHMALSHKISLCFIFLLGSFIVVVSIVRVVFINMIDVNNLDLTWAFTDVTIWTAVELNLACVCACLPCLRPILTLVKTGGFFRPPAPSYEDRAGPSRNLMHSDPPSHKTHGLKPWDGSNLSNSVSYEVSASAIVEPPRRDLMNESWYNGR